MSDCSSSVRSVPLAYARGPLLVLGAVLALMLGPGARAAVAATPCADLVVSSVAVNPTTPAVGQPATVTVNVANNGTCAAEAFGVQWTSNILSPPQPAVAVGGLGPGASTSVNIPFTFPRTGLFTSTATVDPTNTVPETNESNNTSLKLITVSSGIDLTISSLTINPAKPIATKPATVSITVTNQGVNPAGSFNVTWSAVNGVVAATVPVAGLAGGASTTLQVPYTYAAAGTFVGFANADSGNTVSETNELNNSAALTVTVVPLLPDLTITNITTSPNPAFAGSDVTATVTVANIGPAAAGPFSVQWLPALGAVPVSTQVSGLPAGGTVTVNLDSVFAFVGQFAGTVLVDPNNAVAEVNELNNSAPTQVTAVPPSLNAQKIATGGFGDQENSFSWSMAWFKGKLYVGTARDEHCVEQETLNFYFPGQGYYDGPLDTQPQANCPPDPYDMDLRAEIWQYTPGTSPPGTGTWQRVYQATADIPNPREAGKFVSEDTAFRGMVVYTDPTTGQQTLFAGDVTADEWIPELAVPHPPRILSTTDGTTWTPLAMSPGVIHDQVGTQRPIGFRAMTEFQGHLLVSASAGLTGDGVILQVNDPTGPNPSYVQVTPSSFAVFEMAPYNGTLYVGTGDATNGYSVWKVTDTSTIPWTFKQVVPYGAGQGSAVTSVVSMQTFTGPDGVTRLYVGANGWASGSQPIAEEIRINPDDSWDVVAGLPRTLPDGTVKSPISGLGPGFGNPFNAHMWRAEVYNGALYIGTNDASDAFAGVPGLGQALAPQFGFDIWGTCDGVHWWEVTQNAFGDGQWNFGARTLVATPFGLFIGSANSVQGTSVWLGNAQPCGAGNTQSSTNAPFRPAGSTGTPLLGSASSPHQLLAVGQPCGTALSWNAIRGATRYRILRADYRALTLNVKQAQTLIAQAVPDLTPPPPNPNAPKTQQVSVPGRYTAIGTTTKTTFVDHGAQPGSRYNYEVVAVSSSGETAPPSNVATVPTQAANATFDALNSAIRRLGDSTTAGRSVQLLRLATAVQTGWQHGAGTSLETLGQLETAVDATGAGVHGADGRAAMSDVQEAISELEGRANLASACD